MIDPPASPASYVLHGPTVRLTVAAIREALEECSSCCLDEPEEVEKVVAALLRRALASR